MTFGMIQLVLTALVVGDPLGGDVGGEPILAGCDSVAEERICRLVEKRRLKLFWRPSLDRSLTIHLDGEVVAPAETVVADGLQYIVDVPAGEHVLTAKVLNGWKQEFLRSWQIVDEDPALAPVQRILASDDRDGVRLRRVFDRLMTYLRGSAGNPGRTLRLLSRLAYRFQDPERSRKLRISALPWLRAAEEWSELIEVYHGFGDSTDGSADRWESMAAAAELLPRHLAAYPRHYMIRARLHEADGDLRRARGAAELASIWAERLDQPRDAADSLLMLADFAAIQGRADEARQRIDEAAELAPRIGACYHIRVDSDEGWIAYRLGEATGDVKQLERAWSLFRLAERSLDTTSCSNEAELANMRLNLALTALAWSDGALAAEHLPAPEEAAELHPSQWPWYVLALRHIDLLNGDPGAEDAMAELAADVGVIHEVRWLAALNLARWFSSVGRAVEAEEAFAAAGRLLDAWAIFRPNDIARAAAIVDVRAMESERVAFLLAQERVEEAGCVARRAQARRYEMFAHGAQRGDDNRARLERFEALLAARGKTEAALFEEPDRTQGRRLRTTLATLRRRLIVAHDEIISLRGAPTERGCDTFRPPAADELVLVYHPLGAGEWVAIGLTEDAADHVWFDETDLQGGSFEWDEALLRPFGPHLAAKNRVRLIATGPISQIPVHALILDTDQRDGLGPERAVAWTLDLPAMGLPAARRRTAAILIGDTDGLSHARKEADLLYATLLSWQVEVVWSAERLARVLHDGGRLELLYAVGHGAEDGGFQLEAERTASAVDFAAIPLAPRAAIFSACHAALTGPSPAGEEGPTCPGEQLEDLRHDRLPAFIEVGVGAAQALLLSGTEVLVAPQGSLCDMDGWDLFSSMFEDIAGSEYPDYSKIVSTAQTQLDHEVLHGWWRVRTILRG